MQLYYNSNKIFKRYKINWIISNIKKNNFIQEEFNEVMKVNYENLLAIFILPSNSTKCIQAINYSV